MLGRPALRRTVFGAGTQNGDALARSKVQRVQCAAARLATSGTSSATAASARSSPGARPVPRSGRRGAASPCGSDAARRSAAHSAPRRDSRCAAECPRATGSAPISTSWAARARACSRAGRSRSRSDCAMRRRAGQIEAPCPTGFSIDAADAAHARIDGRTPRRRQHVDDAGPRTARAAARSAARTGWHRRPTTGDDQDALLHRRLARSAAVGCAIDGPSGSVQWWPAAAPAGRAVTRAAIRAARFAGLGEIEEHARMRGPQRHRRIRAEHRKVLRRRPPRRPALTPRRCSGCCHAQRAHAHTYASQSAWASLRPLTVSKNSVCSFAVIGPRCRRRSRDCRARGSASPRPRCR